MYTPMMRVISGSYNIRCIHMRATASFGSSLVFILYTERECDKMEGQQRCLPASAGAGDPLGTVHEKMKCC